MEQGTHQSKMLCRIVLELGENRSKELLERIRHHSGRHLTVEKLSELLNHPSKIPYLGD